MNDQPDAEQSKEACPVCGEHRLTLLHFPETSVAGVRPYDELYAMGDRSADTAPGIGCLACGSEWRDLAAFRAAAKGFG